MTKMQIIPQENDKTKNVRRVCMTKRMYKGKIYYQKIVTIPLTMQDIKAGDFIKFKKVEVV